MKPIKTMITLFTTYIQSLVGSNPKDIINAIDPDREIVRTTPREIQLEARQKFIDGLVSADKEYTDEELALLSADEKAAVKNEHFNNDLNRTIAGCLYDSLNDIIGLQPMTGPVGFCFMMKYNEQPSESQTEGKRLSLTIEKEVVEAASRKLQSAWTTEAAQDALRFHNIDLDREIKYALAQEIATEYVMDVISRLTTLAGDPVKEIEVTDYPDPNKLLCEINVAANQIAAKTRRGAGNYIICSPTFVSWLETNELLIPHSPSDNDRQYGSLTLKHVGTLNSRPVRVYCNQYSTTDDVIVGYQGATAVDAGLILCPYVPAIPTKALDLATFQPQMQVVTRYGVAVNKPLWEKDSDTCSYYKRLTVKLPKETNEG